MCKGLKNAHNSYVHDLKGLTRQGKADRSQRKSYNPDKLMNNIEDMEVQPKSLQYVQKQMFY